MVKTKEQKLNGRQERALKRVALIGAIPLVVAVFILVAIFLSPAEVTVKVEVPAPETSLITPMPEFFIRPEEVDALKEHCPDGELKGFGFSTKPAPLYHLDCGQGNNLILDPKSGKSRKRLTI